MNLLQEKYIDTEKFTTREGRRRIRFKAIVFYTRSRLENGDQLCALRTLTPDFEPRSILRPIDTFRRLQQLMHKAREICPGHANGEPLFICGNGGTSSIIGCAREILPVTVIGPRWASKGMSVAMDENAFDN